MPASNNEIHKIMPAIGMAMGILMFLGIYGHEILAPSFIGWTMGGDGAQHFLGWQYFRSEPWTFPLGAIKTYPYPEGSSIVYTDSIPLLAIPFKLISPLLPDTFQYHGLWLLLCYALQGYFGALLMQRLTSQPALIIAVVLLFLLSPVMVGRSGTHEALSAHWILLASLYLYFATEQLDYPKHRLRWLALLTVAMLVHFYLFFMAFILFLAYLKKSWIPKKQGRRQSSLLFLASTMVLLGMVMWLIGYFVIPAKYGTTAGFGRYSMNLLAPFHSGGMSTFFPPFPLATDGQYEGFNYLGLGVFGLLSLAGYVLTVNKGSRRLGNHFPLLAAVSALFLLAISNKITLGSNVLFQFDLPSLFDKLSGVLRSSGRLFWPVTYLLIIATVAIISRHFKKTTTALLLWSCLGLQTVDLIPAYWRINYAQASWESPLKSAIWQKIAAKVEYVAMVPPVANNRFADDYIPFALFANSNNLRINAAYTARVDSTKRNRYVEGFMQDFKSGKLDGKTLYIINSTDLYPPLDPGNKFAWKQLDGYPIIVPKEGLPDIDGLDDWPRVVNRDSPPVTVYELISLYSHNGQAILLSVRDDASKHLPNELLAAMQPLGSQLGSLAYQGSYAAIIVNGKLVAEKVDNNEQAILEQKVFQTNVRITSAGANVGDKAEISIDHWPYSLNGRGINAVVLENDGKSFQRYTFDTHLDGHVRKQGE